MKIFNYDRQCDCCVITADRLYTYGEILDFSERIKSLNLSRNLVLSLCENSIGSVLGYVAFLYTECVPILVSTEIDKILLKNIINKYFPKYIWMPKSLYKHFDMLETSVVFQEFDYCLLRTSFPTLTNCHIVLHPDLALLLSTSGSTGSPKLVRLSYENILSNTVSICEYLKISRVDRPITTLPMNYSYGLSVINTHLYAGASIILTDQSYAQKTFWDLFKNNSATSFSGVPYTFEILKRIHFERMNLPSLKCMTQAGGKLSEELQSFFAEYATKRNIDFFIMYGQTEATARMSYLDPKLATEKIGSIGKAIPGGRFEIRDDQNNIINQPGVKGNLFYCGTNVFMGYADSINDLCKENLHNGLLDTGDLAEYDNDNFLYIKGRKKRFIKIYGNRVNLDEIESILKKKYSDFKIVCCGKDDHLVACVLKPEKDNCIVSDIAEFTKMNARAFSVKWMDAFPITENGKIAYDLLNKEI
jgi:acyl-CoA synthetase (AMP-forming)/AMP-acid ligase II